jgi:alpha-galactosidase/6-phospho-beta-glucosidase family protein
MRKVVAIGGGGVRTPLLVYGPVQSQEALDMNVITLFDRGSINGLNSDTEQ